MQLVPVAQWFAAVPGYAVGRWLPVVQVDHEAEPDAGRWLADPERCDVFAGWRPDGGGLFQLNWLTAEGLPHMWWLTVGAGPSQFLTVLLDAGCLALTTAPPFAASPVVLPIPHAQIASWLSASDLQDPTSARRN